MAEPHYSNRRIRVPAGRDVIADRRSYLFQSFDPARLIGLAAGGFMVVIGGIALARTGLDFDGVEGTHTEVGGIHHTSVLAAVEVAFGLLAIAASAMPYAGRGLLAFLGVVALGFGVAVLADPTRLHRTLGVHDRNGWIAIAVGVVLVLAELLPRLDIWSARRRVDADRPPVDF
jgi:hypothetical protein